jgi:DNA-binding GntR family transcriptional regulator
MFNHTTMTEAAALELRKAILRGDYPPGTRLVPAKLEEDLRLSRTAIREAIRELVGTGLANSETNKGACVAEPLPIEEIREIFDVRYRIEGRAALLGTERISPEAIDRMEALLAAIDQHNGDLRYTDFLLNQQFHSVLYRASGWRYLVKVIDRMFDQVLAFRSSLYRQLSAVELKTLLTWKSFEPYHQDHHRILALVKAGDGEGAREAVIANVKRGLEGMEQLLLFLQRHPSGERHVSLAGLKIQLATDTRLNPNPEKP